jgi:hypothetical protein
MEMNEIKKEIENKIEWKKIYDFSFLFILIIKFTLLNIKLFFSIFHFKLNHYFQRIQKMGIVII